ncbi:MAG: adenylosuccinate lyase [Candidatus Azobacteroides pseudotrichonymphae]|jgi:adenylosuccinate lyase|uniref:Adenylosuccinate lyase n=1 Tax=Azobacteroides pseudotrichonymphae genomovar. CFP2 TaxID=511995 RepID=B6YRK9_AZOPC|nr:adenylosuccinate lyase [Candidatus Azobacteroides pseudotrichonymphae]BAG83831.1 adenylosuccinate lyase [Candidatus Azobacteroides pseudotrichonymphae genomovar. CFP2]GMO36360.1 MAG: adenylosuccinate lyase [Candidatus Azobacteroides pseudotrichonymphae]
MRLNTLTAISPIDGRYRSKTASLSAFFSEYALIRYRVYVEVEYFISLCEIPLLQLKGVNLSALYNSLRDIYRFFSIKDAESIKQIERTINHDVKSVEYFLKKRFDELSLGDYKEFVHFGLTSQDINNTAVPLSIKHALENDYVPMLKQLLNMLQQHIIEWENISMLARTHGQPASPTRLGKEVQVFVSRLKQQLKLLRDIPISAKFGGATGNYNAHVIAYPQIDWKKFGDDFICKKIGLVREEYTTQVSNYDNLSALLDALKRINTVLLDLSRDFWLYISMEYFKQKIVKDEIGSSAMPHKVNPIDFENAEGNLGIANTLLEHLSAKLPISRLQRDLTDSTVLRNIGVPFAHISIAFQSLQKGLNKLVLNRDAIKKDLENAWAVVAEGIQTILRREGYSEPYEMLKSLTRTNEQITEKSIQVFIDTLNIDESIKKELRSITPHSYTGI